MGHSYFQQAQWINHILFMGGITITLLIEYSNVLIYGTKTHNLLVLAPKWPQFDLYDLNNSIKVIFDKFNGKFMGDLWGVVLYIHS